MKRPRRLLDQVRDQVRVRQLSRRTEKAYVGWIRRFILFHGKRHPAEMAEAEVNAFLTHLAVEGRVSASTQTQALCAVLFLYRHVLGIQLGKLEGLVRAKRRRKLPVVLTLEEVRGYSLGSPVRTASLQRSSTAPASGSWRAYGCASRVSTLSTGKWSCAKARAAKTG